ncbi:MAG TPA: FAD-binding domain-containing protein, partial [Fimbriimonadaceae bacterium]|nr:FAD-binding domain-containing protein [Fimbriimonadaceae bacterium]
EFYQMILAEFPHVVDRAFKAEYAAIDWPGADEHFEAWRDGRTGFPIVDAAMRCLNATGWMHNRLRMIVASFLVKDLLIDWRRGEAYFARKLLDFELASNNGGWQWSASTGCDAQPYFRIFNPWLQSAKFDPEGEFIRLWCPELSGFANAHIHDPSQTSEFDQLAAGCRIGSDYPAPIVDHGRQKSLALSLFNRMP